MKKIFMTIVMCFCIVSFAFASGFDGSIGTNSTIGTSYYGFLMNPYKVQSFVHGSASYDFDNYGKLGVNANIGLGYDDQYVEKDNHFSEFVNLYYTKTWENFLLTEIGYQTNQRLFDKDLFTDEFYGKIAMNVDGIPFHPFVSYSREWNQFGINRVNFGMEQTLPISDWMFGENLFGLYTYASFDYVKTDPNSSLGDFEGFHTFEFKVGVPMYLPANLQLTPTVSYVTAFSNAINNVKQNSFNGETSQEFLGSLDLTYRF